MAARFDLQALRRSGSGLSLLLNLGLRWRVESREEAPITCLSKAVSMHHQPMGGQREWNIALALLRAVEMHLTCGDMDRARRRGRGTGRGRDRLPGLRSTHTTGRVTRLAATLTCCQPGPGDRGPGMARRLVWVPQG